MKGATGLLVFVLMAQALAMSVAPVVVSLVVDPVTWNCGPDFIPGTTQLVCVRAEE